MAVGGLSAALKVRYRLTPWWVKVLVVFLASRVVTTALLLQYASIQPQNAWTSASPGYFDFAKIWDGHWYFIIAAVGYPTELPFTDDGHVGENAWAFMPAYPALVRVIMAVTGLDFAVAAVVVSVGFALAAALMLYRLIALVVPASTSLFAVVLFCFGPLSPIMQVAYAESMHAFLLAAALYLLVQRRYWMLLPVVAVMALTRPSGLAFALALLLHVVHRWWMDRTGREPFPVRERVGSVVAGLFSALMGFVWLLIAGLVTGRPTAYLETELAWRAAYIGYEELVPFTPWFRAAQWWAPWWQIPGWLVVTALVLALVCCALLLFTPPFRRLGVDIRFWLASYALYLLAVFFPQSSTFRLLLPLFPGVGALAIPTSLLYRAALITACVLGQWGWIHVAWWVDGYDWTPP